MLNIEQTARDILNYITKLEKLDRIDEFFGKVENLHNHINEVHGKLAGELSAVNGKIDAVSGRIDAAKDFQEKSANDIAAIKQKLIEQQQAADGWQKEYDKVKGEYDKLNGDYNNLQDERNSLAAEKQSLQDAENALRDELEKARRTNEDKDSEIRRLNEELKAERDKVQAAESANASLENFKHENEGIIDGLKAQNSAWEDMTGIYKPVLESLRNCGTFAALLEENQIGGDSPVELFKIAVLIGKNIDFAKAVGERAQKVKKENGEPMNQSEIAVYKALNECYRSIWNIDFDIFVLPGGKAVTEEFTKIPFNKSEVVDMKDPRNKSSRYTQEIYVPLLKAQSGNVYSLAQVKAGNV